MAGMGYHKSLHPRNPGLGGEEGGVGCWTGRCTTATSTKVVCAPQPISLSLPMRSCPVADIGYHVSIHDLGGPGVGGQGEEGGCTGG